MKMEPIGQITRRAQWIDRRNLLLQAAPAAWLLAMVATPIAMWTVGETSFPWLASMGVLAQATATLVGLSQGDRGTWPFARILRSAGMVLILAWLAEAWGQATGWPFGVYHYTPALQPQIGGVPVLIPLAWWMMLVPAWSVAETILFPIRPRLGRAYPWVLAALAALAFTAWDLSLDPQMVAGGLWAWDPPGAYFGIPWTNFLGWWLVSALITWLVRPDGLPRGPLFLIYAVTWLFQAIRPGLFWGQPGPAWAGFAGMGVFVALAVYAERKVIPRPKRSAV